MELMLLSLLLIKHYIFDFVLQTEEHIKYKGVYGDKRGIDHSMQHAWGTAAILVVWNPSFFHVAVLLSAIEGIIHYHIDYIKMKYFQYEMGSRKFWLAFGADQLLHNLTYVAIILLFIL